MPVFRYALERWQADPYDLILYHRGPLSEEQEEWVQTMEQASEDIPYTNLFVTRVDLDSQDVPEEALALWEKQDNAQPPWLVLLFAARPGPPDPIWSGPLTPTHVARILDSPARRELAKRLGEGESAVWILLEVGDPERDEAAQETLTQALEKLKKELALPDLAAWGMPEVPEGWPELKVDFSVISVSRKDVKESILVEMLLRVEDDLLEYQEPMALPLFGRGRALYALVGRGIHEENVAEACAFLVGPCLCQVKGMIPGRDIIFSAHWDALLGDGRATDLLPPPFPALAEVQATPETSRPEASKPSASQGRPGEQPGEEEGTGLLLYSLVAALLAALVGGAFSLLFIRRGRS